MAFENIIAGVSLITIMITLANAVALYIAAKIVGGSSTLLKAVLVALAVFAGRLVIGMKFGFNEWFITPVTWVVYVFAFHVNIFRAIILSIVYFLVEVGLVVLFGMLGLATLSLPW